MIRSELIGLLADETPSLNTKDIERVVDLVFDTIAFKLVSGGRVELRGFGAFSTRMRQARTGRNPRSGASVAVAAKRAIHFKPGKEMRERLNPSGGLA